MSEQDILRRFTFENLGVRGELVHLNASWLAIQTRHPYPSTVAQQLGQALAAVVLLSATIKFEGSLILQTQSQGPLHTLVAQATHHGTIRGLAQWQDAVPDGDLSATFGPGRMVFTLQNSSGEPYQGIVGLEGANLAEAIESYFVRSEQLATRLWLAADGERAAGLFIQELPSRQSGRDDWDRITLLANTLTSGELLHLPSEDLLFRLFNEDPVRLFDPEHISFRCGCSREKISTILNNLGREELESLLEEQGKIEVSCEFCNHLYEFDAVDIQALLADAATNPFPHSKH